MKNKETSAVEILVGILGFAFLLWLFCSWADVVRLNSNPDTAKELATHGWNFFVRFFG